MEFQNIAKYIQKIVSAKNGNYMVFFPSYRFLEQVYEEFFPMMGEQTDCIVQTTGMKEEEREEFLGEFEKERKHSLVGFCVMGGIFGEGIDLKEELLIGAIVVGTGLPQVGQEREILRQYFETHSGEGFDYAYRYPGMNKVLQAAGRVIRTQEDRGIILLLDERFLQADYVPLFPREWRERKVCNLKQMKEEVERFWKEVK